MKTIIIFFSMLLLCQFAYSQNTVKGKITDQDNKPLAGVAIFVVQQNKSTISNADGNFQLNNLPNGKINIQFSYVGYEHKIETVFLNNSTLNLDIILKETFVITDEIVVTGAYNFTQHDNAVKIDVLDMSNPSNPITTNLCEVLTKVPGVDMISKGIGVSKPVIRGLSMSYVLVLNNNVRNENYQFSDHHPLGIDEFGIDRVEIIKGPASLLYGSDAIGGVVNFIKEKPAPVGKIVGDYNLQLYSNSLGMTNNIGIKGASNNFYGSIRYGNKTDADYLQGGGDFVPNTRFYGNSLKTNVGYNNSDMALNLYYDYSNYNVGLAEPDAIDFVKSNGRSRKPEVFYMNLTNQTLSSENKFFINNYLLEVNGAYQNSGLIHVEGPDEISIDMSLQTFSYETRLYFPSTYKSEYIIGFQGINQINTNNNNREVILLPNATISNYSVYGLLQFTFFDKLNLQTGIRYDYKQINSEAVNLVSDPDYRPALDKKIGNFSGSLGATYHLSEQMLFRFNFASAYRSPTLPELTSKGLHEERYELGDINLQNEKGYETDLSAHYHSQDITFDIAGFYNILNDYIFISPTNDTSSEGDKIFKYMQANSVLYGFEADFHYHPADLDWFHFEANFSKVTGKKDNGEFLPFIPSNKLRCEIRLEKESLWFFNNTYFKINTQTAFAQNNHAPFETSTEGYTLIDIGVGVSFKISSQRITIGLAANNLLDTKYIDHLSTLKEVGYFNPGRNIAFSMKIPFDLK